MTQKEIKDIIELNNSLYNQEKKKTITIAGLSKNAGKTSFLNYITQFVPDDCRYVISTTGHDGEDQDFLTGLKKPKVLIKKGNFFTSIPSACKDLSLNIKTIKKLNYKVLSHHLYLYQALNNLEIEIFGASHVSDQEHLCNLLYDEGLDFIFIDGSLDRKSIALSPIVDHVIVLGSASFGNIELISNEFERIYMLSKIELLSDQWISQLTSYIAYKLNDKIYQTNFSTLFDNEDEMIKLIKINPELIYIPSAFTDTTFNRLKSTLLSYQGLLVFQHPLKILTSYCHLLKMHSLNLRTVNRLPLSAFAINSYSTEEQHLDCEFVIKILKKKFPYIPLIDTQKCLLID